MSIARVTRKGSYLLKYSASSSMRLLSVPQQITFAYDTISFYHKTPRLLIGISEEATKVDARTVELKAFIQFLKEKCGFTFHVNKFDHRIMLQKYVFLAKSLGWPNDYAYNIYIRGPYSPDLAKDYYNPEVISALDTDETTICPIDDERFVHVIKGKDIAWPEVGTTMLSIYINNKERIDGVQGTQFLLERTKSIKSDYDENGFIERVLRDLAEYRLIGPN
jgi:uncharacterized protein YwgA